MGTVGKAEAGGSWVMGMVRAECRPPHGRTRVTVKRMLENSPRAGGRRLWAQKVVD